MDKTVNDIMENDCLVAPSVMLTMSKRRTADKIVDKLLDWPEMGNIAGEDKKNTKLLDIFIGSMDSPKLVFLRRT